MPANLKIGKVDKKSDLPAGLDSVIYYCPNCKSKSTYGADYFVQVGAPVACPVCSTPFDQNEQVHRFVSDSDEDLRMKRDDLKRSRGEKVIPEGKPEDPEVLKKQRIKELEDEILILKGQRKLQGVKLGP